MYGYQIQRNLGIPELFINKVVSGKSSQFLKCFQHDSLFILNVNVFINTSQKCSYTSNYYCIQGNVHPVLFSPHSPSLPMAKFKTGQILLS